MWFLKSGLGLQKLKDFNWLAEFLRESKADIHRHTVKLNNLYNCD